MDFSFAILFYDPRFIVAEEDKAQAGYEEQRLNRFDFRSRDLAKEVPEKLPLPTVAKASIILRPSGAAESRDPFKAKSRLELSCSLSRALLGRTAGSLP